MRTASFPLALLMLVALGRSAHAQEPSPAPAREPNAAEPRGAEHPGAPPVPVEVMAGTAYTSVVLVLSKPLADASRWGIFHENTLVAGYDADEGSVAAQTLLTFAPGGGVRLTAGAFYGTVPGVSPTVGAQYLRPGRRWFVLVSPRVNVERDPSYSVFTILRYTRGPATGRRLYLSLQALNTFDARQHLRSYQWARLGLDQRGTQVGLGVNFDESGPRPRVATSAGVFVRREVF